MNLLFELSDENNEIKVREYGRVRKAARGIIVRDDGKIAIQKKTQTNEYKLIGGGAKDDEDIQEAFKREVLEEAGCEVEIIKCLGIVEESIHSKNAKQFSNIFVARVTKDLKKTEITEKEQAEGAELIWITPEEALEQIINSYDKLVSSTHTKDYDTTRMKFISIRDRKILEYYLENED